MLWPEAGITKLELVEYFVAVSGAFLAANGDRPVSLQRFGGDVTGDSYFSKNPPKGAPEWLRSVVVTYPSSRSHPQLVLDEPAAIVWAAQMNTVVFHAWPSRAERSDYPDQLRIDLDPQPGTALPEATAAALGMRDGAGGGRAHRVREDLRQPRAAPVRADPTGVGVPRRAARGDRRGARARAARAPTRSPRPGGRSSAGERIFLDYNQAARDRTIAGAYSPRPLPAATVSCPVTWDEVEAGVDPGAFTVRTVPERLATVGDPWATMHDHAAGLETLLGWWERDLASGGGRAALPARLPEDARASRRACSRRGPASAD